MNRKEELKRLGIDDRIQEIIERYKPENFNRVLKHCFPKHSKIINQMSNKQQISQMKAVEKSQKDIIDNSFKRECRLEAIRMAERVVRPSYTVDLKTGNDSKKDILKEADKIYQWLIKVLK